MKRILFASSEVVPFIKTGGLADVVGSLPKYFPKSEYDVRVILPKYMCMKQEFKDKMEIVCECQVQLNWRTQYAGVYQIEEDGVTFYFIDNEYYFAGPAPYGDIYQDAEKFAYFSKAVLTVLPLIGFQPDVIHCHDWQTGLVPVFLQAMYRGDEFYRHIRTVYTIHNLKFQGRWYIDAVRDATGLSPDYFTMDTLESYGQANLLKGGLVFSDYLTTVSESYAKEIQSSEGGEGLDGLLRSKSYCLSGIVNGLDYEVLNPATDSQIAKHFEGDVVSYKKENKRDLQERLGLAVREDAFLIGMVSRLTDQKGFDLVDYILDEILGDDRIQLVVLGTGEERYENMFRFFAGKYPGRVSANIYYSEEVAQKIYAGCDAFLMPSLFEPCGLSQLMSLRYGTVPLVRETGGLKDTVEPYNEFEHTGTGFSFHNYNAHEMLYMIRYACKIYFQYPDEWLGIVKRGMEMDFSWNASCKQYAQLYDALIEDEAKKIAEEKKRQEEYERLEEQRREEELLARMRLEKQLEREEEERKKAEEERRIAEAKAEEERRIAEAKAEEERRIAEAKAEEERKIAEAKAEEERKQAEALKAEKRKAAAEKRKATIAAKKAAAEKAAKEEAEKAEKRKAAAKKRKATIAAKKAAAEKSPEEEAAKAEKRKAAAKKRKATMAAKKAAAEKSPEEEAAKAEKRKAAAEKRKATIAAKKAAAEKTAKEEAAKAKKGELK